MAGYDLEDDDGWSIDLDAIGDDVVEPMIAQAPLLDESEHDSLRERLVSSSSARGPPALRS